MGRQKNETVNNLLGECPKLTQKEYRRRYDGVAKALHWNLCGQNEFERYDKWYEHSPENVESNAKCKLLWDFSIQTGVLVLELKGT